MITTERQYRITKAEARRFEEALLSATGTESLRIEPRIHQAMREGMESQLQELREQIGEYEALRSGQVTVLELDSLKDLPEALIRARIASGLTQKELAARLGLKEQQIQRYEATRYAGVSLDRIDEVATALGVTIKERVLLPSSRGEDQMGRPQAP
ncbi:MAG: helix-turn-helix transcriptional regulator [Dehalococcoidia bacterium]|nr:helix-turn-helix transcriptional regulator [Dehalococcoidia bacterium]